MIDHPALSEEQRTPLKVVAHAARKGFDSLEQLGRGDGDSRNWVEGLRRTLREVGV